MQGLSVRLAKGLNRLMGRHGRTFADRFRAHVLKTPAETRNGLAYVLLNHRSHMARIGKRAGGVEVGPEPRTVTSAPQTWLLRRGWKRRGPLALSETPARKREPDRERAALPAAIMEAEEELDAGRVASEEHLWGTLRDRRRRHVHPA